jgi:hypothetical protein
MQFMDGRQFDELRRALTGTRRAALASLVAAVSGLSHIPVTSARKKRKKKKNKKRCRGCWVCTYCVKGKCRSGLDHTPCGGECQQCIGGRCVSKPADTPCSTDRKCLNTVCNLRPTCDGFGVQGCAPPLAAVCCSDVCEFMSLPMGTCGKAAAGKPCKVNFDCASNVCAGYRCQ